MTEDMLSTSPSTGERTSALNNPVPKRPLVSAKMVWVSIWLSGFDLDEVHQLRGSYTKFVGQVERHHLARKQGFGHHGFGFDVIAPFSPAPGL